ncbi:RING-H2 finger protein ATL57 [Striga hermonthica]|uniref:RING-type E3 ubiquitin transferase n=1 Tax=Striga hermonthica TaxID=68872 RepID=A0A9N7NRC6_STRHE|nr:RING-H2 finger protein ATL57 [Striga hermonthica]
MNPTHLILLHRRRLLQLSKSRNITETSNFLSPTTAAAADGEPTFQPVNNDSPSSSSSATAAGMRPFEPATHFDSSMALTILVLLTALFFMGFFSVYIRRFGGGGGGPPSSAAAGPRRQEKRRGGLDPSAVRSLPLVAYGGDGRHRGAAGGCPICLTEFEEGEAVKLIPYCGHVFHDGCIDTWLASHMTCPLCRSAQLFKTGDDEGGGVLGCDAAQV